MLPLCHTLKNNLFHFGPIAQYGCPAILTPMNDPDWYNSCRLLELDPGVFYSTETTENDFFKVIWDTGASEVITSNPADFIGGYNKPTLPLILRGVPSGTMVEGIGLIREFRAKGNPLTFPFIFPLGPIIWSTLTRVFRIILSSCPGFKNTCPGSKNTLIRTLPVSVYQSYDTNHDISTLFVVIQPLLTFSSRDERVSDTPWPKFRH